MDAVQSELEKRGYAVLQQLSEGGMGVIFTVHHRDLDEIRVAKTVHEHLAASAEIQDRFKDEAKKLAAVRHQNIALLFDFSAKPDAMFSIMEYIDGVTLAQLLEQQKRPSVAMALEIAVQALRALGFLHRIGYIHRDVAPDNLMLTKDPDDRPLVKLIDLGIAKDAARKTVRTMSGSFLGKLRYAAPEQFESADKVTPASDLYSFAVVLYEFLTGVLPVRGNSETELMAGHCLHAPRSFEETDPDERIPQELREILLRGLEKDPAKRPAAAKELISALQPIRDRLSLDEEELDQLLDLFEGSGSEQIGSTVGPVEQLRAEADKAEQGGDVATALDMLRRLVDFMPDDEELRQRIAALEKRSDDEQALSSRASHARTLLQDQRYSDARRALDTLMADTPGHEVTQSLTAEIQEAASERLNRARQHRSDGRFREALDRVDEALELSPQSNEARELHDQIEREWRRAIEDTAQEVQSLIEGASQSLELPDDEITSASIQQRMQDLDRARGQLERLSELQPEHSSAGEWSRMIHQLAGDLATKRDRAARRERVKTSLARAEGLRRRLLFGSARRLLKRAEAETKAHEDLQDLRTAVTTARHASDRGVRRRNLLVVSLVGAVIFLTGGWKLWEVTTRTQRKISAVLDQPENSSRSLEQKLADVRGLSETFPEGEVPERLSDAMQRLVRLEELYRQLSRLRDHVQDSLEEGTPPDNAMEMAAISHDSLKVGVQRFLDEYPEDPTALQLRARAQHQVSRLAEELGCATEVQGDHLVLRVVVDNPNTSPLSSLLTHKPGFVSWVQPKCPHDALIGSEGSKIVVVDGDGRRMARPIPAGQLAAKEYAARVNRLLEARYVAALLWDPEPPRGAEPLELELDWTADRSGYQLRVSPVEDNLAVFVVDAAGGVTLACPQALGEPPPSRGGWLDCGSRDVRGATGIEHVIALRTDQPWRPLLEEALGRSVRGAERLTPPSGGGADEAIEVARAIREHLLAASGFRRGATSYSTLTSPAE